MIDTAEVARLLLDHCEALPLPVAYPETPQAFEPPADGRYYEVRFFPNGSAWEAVGAGSLGQGLLQVTVIYPKNRGLIAPYEHATAAKEHFNKSLSLHGDGIRVTISNEPIDGAPLVEASEVRVPVTVRWNATAI